MEGSFWDSLIVSLGLLLALLGMLGAVLPVLPGTFLALAGLLLYQFIPELASSWYTFTGFALAALVGTILDYVVPAIGAKKMGGSKWGVRGTFAGIIAGIFFSPFGLVSIFILPFLGALVGELLHNRKDQKRAFKAALGSFFGFLVTTGYNLMLCIVIFAFMFQRLWALI